MCLTPHLACEVQAGPNEELRGTEENDRLVADLATSNILSGDGGDDVLIGRTNADLLQGGLGDDKFYTDPRVGLRVETGPGFDIVVVDQYSETTNNMVAITDANGADIIRLYNPETQLYKDVLFGDVTAVIMDLKGALTSSELLAGIFDFGEPRAFICDVLSDFNPANTKCFNISLTDNNNDMYAP